VHAAVLSNSVWECYPSPKRASSKFVVIFIAKSVWCHKNRRIARDFSVGDSSTASSSAHPVFIAFLIRAFHERCITPSTRRVERDFTVVSRSLYHFFTFFWPKGASSQCSNRSKKGKAFAKNFSILSVFTRRGANLTRQSFGKKDSTPSPACKLTKRHKCKYCTPPVRADCEHRAARHPTK